MGKSSKSSTGPSKFAKPYITAGANALQNAYQGNQANVSNLSNILQQNLGNVTTNAFNNPTLGAANSYTQNVLGGQYLNGNPYLDNIVGQTADDVANRVNGAIGLAGRTGGDAHSQILARELANSENNLRYTDYNNQMSRMDQAAQNATSLAGAGNQGIATLLAYLQEGADLPLSNARNYASGIAGLLGNSNTQTQTPSTGSTIQNIIGTGLSLASLFSDRRLKRDIELIGRASDGLGWYKFRYLWDDTPREGVMADEVARLRPWALGKPVAGFQTVRMGLL